MKFWTSLLITSSITFTALCSYYLYRELSGRVDKKGGEVIGTISFKKRSAARRYNDNVIWEEISQETPIFNYDAIRTLEYSSAVVSLNDGTKIELDQNTLLVVIQNEKGVDINFDRGGVSAESGSKGLVTLNSKDAKIALDKGGVSVNSSDAGMNVQVNSGSAKILSDGKVLNVTSDEIATLRNGIAESKKGSLFPDLPRHNSYIISFGKERSVNLVWRTGSPGEVNVEISMSTDFSKPFRKIKSSGQSADVSLPAGDYYWRVVRGDAASRSVKFTVLSDRKPDLIAPGTAQRVTVTDGAENVTFRWEKSKYASMYEILVARDSQMTDIALTLSSRISTISTPSLKPGKYYWTVKSIYPTAMAAESSLSGPGSFDLERADFSQMRPVPIDQGPLSIAAPFTLKWKGVQGSKSYRADISSDPDFADIVFTGTTVNSFLKVEKKIPEGKYYWRVTAMRGGANSLSISALLTLTRPVEIVPVSPADGAVLFEKPEILDFSWRDPNAGGRYLLEISDRKDFKTIKKSIEVTSSRAGMKSFGEGDFFWRVTLKDSSGKNLSASAVSEFIIPSELKSPELTVPKNNEKIVPGMKRRLKFAWSKVSGANEYEIELFQRIAGKEKQLMIYTSKKNYIELANQTIFTPGIYSWQVRAMNIRKGKVAAYRESAKSYFEVDEIQLLPAPVVKNPGVLYK